MRRSAAVDLVFLSNYQMHSLVPTFRRQRIDKLKLVSQADEKSPITQPIQHPVVPSATPPQAIAAAGRTTGPE